VVSLVTVFVDDNLALTSLSRIFGGGFQKILMERLVFCRSGECFLMTSFSPAREGWYVATIGTNFDELSSLMVFLLL
jgi:hypothetical protein